MRFRANSLLVIAVLGGAAAWLTAAALSADKADPEATDKAAESGESPEEMTPREKEELNRKKERFDKLSEDERKRLRGLHAELAQHPRGEHLKQIAARYADWLKTLSSGQRAELLELPPERRLDQIRKYQAEQRTERMRDLFRTRFKPEDIGKIFAWLKDYAKSHEGELLSLLSPEMQQNLRRMPDDMRRRAYLFRATQQRPPGRPLPVPTAEEFERLRGQLSDEAREVFDGIAEDDKKLGLILSWARGAMMPMFNPEELEHFYANVLERKQKDELEQLPDDKFQQELRRLYLAHKFHKRYGGQRPTFYGRPGGRPPHFQNGPKGPRRDGSRGGFGPRPEHTEPHRAPPGQRPPGEPPRPPGGE